MSTPALAVDVTALALGVLSAGLNVRVVTELPADLADVLPVIRVARIGGGDDGIVLDQALMAFNVYAATGRQARELAYAIGPTLQAVLGQVSPAGSTGSGVITQVRKLSGPIWAGYENTYVRHQAVTHYLRVKLAQS